MQSMIDQDNEAIIEAIICDREFVLLGTLGADFTRLNHAFRQLGIALIDGLKEDTQRIKNLIS